MTIGDLFKQIAGGAVANSYLAKVKSVDKDERTCTVSLVESDLEVEGVRLQSSGGKKAGLFLKPKVGSYVMVMLVSKVWIVVLAEETDEILLNGDEFGGLIKVEKAVERLNKIEDKVNAVITRFNTHTHLDPVSGASPPPSNAGVTALTKTTASQLENTKVKHGYG